jgi:putative S-adenosyl-L-methionine-dependent methyltransferase
MSIRAVNAAVNATTVGGVDWDPDDAPALVAAPIQVVERARRMGPLPYSTLAAVGSGGGAVGAGGALAEWMVDAIDEWWEAAGRPDPYTVVEVGAGDGSRARQVLGLGPECLGALRYVLVDHGFADMQTKLLPIESPAFLFPGGPGSAGEGDEADEDDVAPASPEIGPLVTSLADVPSVQSDGIIFAVDWVGRLGSDRVEWRDGRWWEIRLYAPPGANGLAEMPVQLVDQALEGARGQPWREAGLDSPVGAGARFAVLGSAAAWLSSTLRVAETGILAVVDRWTNVTEALAAGQVPPLALDQLVHIRRPIEPAPLDLFDGLSVVFWRLG